MLEHFIDIDKNTGEVTGLIPHIEAKGSVTERHRAIKVWRALWRRMAALQYCDEDADPSKQFSNSAPGTRKSVWVFDEVRRLVKRAIRMRYYGLAALLAGSVRWRSPVL